MKIPTVISLALEFIRVLFIFLIGVSILLSLEIWIYNIAGINISEYAWMPTIANIIIILVFYRNVLQFTGWFKGKQNKKLSKFSTKILLGISFILIILPVLLQV